LDCPAKELVKLGKHLKKHNVAVDLVNFGHENTENENTEKLDAFIQAVSSDNNSKMVVIPPGPHNFVDMIVSTILVDEQGNAPAVPMAGVEGVDASMDPELAEAIRMSLEAERERVEREQQRQQASAGAAPERTEGSSTSDKAHDSGAACDVHMEEEIDEETAMALAMSMQQFDTDGDTVMAEEKKNSDASDISIEKALQDPNFVDELLSDLNVSKDDVNIDEILNSLNKDQSKKDDASKK
jgi:26S proteasome regulatory subunit N10